MNERIKELATQALQLVADEHTNGDESRLNTDSYHVKDLIQEKFAALIVKECINKIETHRIPVGNSAAGEMACEWTYDALKEIRDEIKEHFGVKE